MTEPTKKRPTSQKRQARGKNVALYPTDIADVEQIRQHYGLDSFAQAVRRAIRVTMAGIGKQETA